MVFKHLLWLKIVTLEEQFHIVMLEAKVTDNKSHKMNWIGAFHLNFWWLSILMCEMCIIIH